MKKEDEKEKAQARLTRKVASLAARIKKLEKRNQDLVLKARIASSLTFLSPLEAFFASPEFWENTYDSGQADCAQRCIEELQRLRAHCEQIENEAERQQCYIDAAERAARCQDNCFGSFPPPPTP